jgi:uncharacterized protein (TIGR00369 family)
MIMLSSDRIGWLERLMTPENDDPPAAALLSREVLSIDRTTSEGHLRYLGRPDFLNRHGTVQGGLLAAMLDSATAITLLACLGPGETAVTRSLSVDFLRPAKPGALYARTKVSAREGATVEVTGELATEAGETVATASAVLRVLTART